MACVLSAFGRRESNILILRVGILFSLPLFFCGYPWGTHDGWIQQIWQECFSQQFWDGELYPRWLPEPNQGFGGATYFFYPPLPYWAGSVRFSGKHRTNIVELLFHHFISLSKIYSFQENHAYRKRQYTALNPSVNLIFLPSVWVRNW